MQKWAPDGAHFFFPSRFAIYSGPTPPFISDANSTQWSSEMLDKFANDISRSTLYDSADALPLPLWYARQYVRFPKDILVAYAQAIAEEMNRD